MDVRFPTKTKYAAKSLAARVMSGDTKSIASFMLSALKHNQSRETVNAITEAFKNNTITPNNYAALVESIDVRIERTKTRLAEEKKKLADTIKEIRAVPPAEFFTLAMNKRRDESMKLNLSIKTESIALDRARSILDTLNAWWNKAKHPRSYLTVKERAYWKKYVPLMRKELELVVNITATHLKNMQERYDALNIFTRWNLKRRRAVVAMERAAEIDRVTDDSVFSISEYERTLERLTSFKERLAMFVRFLESPLLHEALREARSAKAKTIAAKSVG